MSLIVARRVAGQLCIVSDTKLTYPDTDPKSLRATAAEGLIKTIIINPLVCVSFAGEVDEAEEAFKAIHDDSSIADIIEVLKYHHKASNYKTEFLLCYASDTEPVIFKFKNNEYGTVHSSWIGDVKAFSRFQEIMSGVVKKVKKQKKKENKALPTSSKPTVLYESVQLGYELSIDPLFSKMSSAMDEVIEDTSIATVGGFKVNVIFDDKFYYNRYGKMYRGEFAMVGFGSHFITHGEADEGAYTINFFGMSEDFKQVALHIRQGNVGIVYDRNDNGHLRPHLHKLDEVDFHDLVTERYKIRPAMTTQDRTHKFFGDGRQAFAERKLGKANELFDKALVESVGKLRADILYHKGITLFNLGDQKNGIKAFQEAVALDPRIQVRINNSFAHARPK